jgi:hypothetical protein
MTKKTSAARATAPAKAANSTPTTEDDATPPVAAKAARKAAPQQAAEPVQEPADGAEADDADVPMNRAERRAKGRGGPAAQVPVRGKVTGGHGPAHTQRMWANRRSG